MNEHISQDPNDAVLAPFVEACRTAVTQNDIDEATRRLRARLPQTKPAQQRSWRPKLAAAALMLTGLAVTLPLILPGGSGSAFADVQQWFQSFQTLSVRTQIRTADSPLVDIQTFATNDGNVRIEQAGSVHIITAGTGTFSTLLPERRYFSKPIAVQNMDSDASSDGLKWVNELRDFQGDAVLLEETRHQHGRLLVGHQLVIDATDLTLWSDSATNQPVSLQGQLPGGLTLNTEFTFNTEFDPAMFDIPPGYQAITDE